MKVSKRDKDIILKAGELNFEESIFVPCTTKKEQQKSFTILHNLAKDYCTVVDKEILLIVGKTFQANKLWIKITKEKLDKGIFIKTKTGEVVPGNLKEKTNE